MRSNLLSSFAAGIILSTAVSGAVFLFDKSNSAAATGKTVTVQKTVQVQPSPNEMKNKLTAAGFVVQSKAEYDQNIKAAKDSVMSNASKSSTQTPSATRVFINVTDGMTSIDVGDLLKEANLIPDAFKFSQDIQSKGLENKLKPGIYSVDSKMSYDQLVSSIFK